jgi:DNA-binding NarL/FixJ family response regulator
MNGQQTVDVVRVVVVEDQRSVREGLTVMLDLLDDISVVGVAADGSETMTEVDRHRPQVALVDLHMPVMDGIETTRRLTSSYPSVAVVVLTTYADDASICEALRAGALGYLTKNSSRDDIARAIRAAANAQSITDPVVHKSVIKAVSMNTVASTTELPDGLTRRERDVLVLMAEGLANSDIGASLFVSTNTVKTHISRVFTKTRSKTRAQAIRYAHDHGLTARDCATSLR